MIPILLKLTAPLIAAVATLVAIWFAKKNEGLRYRYLISALAILAWIVTSSVIVIEDLANRKNQDALDAQKMLLQGIRASQGEKSYLKQYVLAQKQLIAQIATYNTEEFMQELQITLADKLEKRKHIDAASEELYLELMVRWQPAYDLILASLKDINDQLGKKGLIKEAGTLNLPILVVDQVPAWKRIRDYVFPDESHLYVNLYPALIDSGRLDRGFRVEVRFNKPENMHETLIIYDFQENSSRVKNVASEKINFEGYQGGANPMLEPEFSKAVTLSLNKAVLYGLVESRTEIK